MPDFVPILPCIVTGWPARTSLSALPLLPTRLAVSVTLPARSHAGWFDGAWGGVNLGGAQFCVAVVPGIDVIPPPRFVVELAKPRLLALMIEHQHNSPWLGQRLPCINLGCCITFAFVVPVRIIPFIEIGG
jgi:hypothetical protein